MALNVTICNDFDINTEVCYNINSNGDKCLNPGACNDPNTDPINLTQNDYIEINAKIDSKGKKCQIGLKVTDGNPKVKIQRSDNMWKLTNDGANTSVQVGAGPDGQ